MKLNKAPDFDRVTEDIRAKAKAAELSTIWPALADEQRAQWVRPLMAVGHSNRTCGAILGITEGQVAGVRDRKKIPSRNKLRGGRKKSNILRLPRRQKK